MRKQSVKVVILLGDILLASLSGLNAYTLCVEVLVTLQALLGTVVWEIYAAINLLYYYFTRCEPL